MGRGTSSKIQGSLAEDRRGTYSQHTNFSYFQKGEAVATIISMRRRKKTSGAVFARVAEESAREDVGEGRSQHPLIVPTAAPLWGGLGPCQTLSVIRAVMLAV